MSMSMSLSFISCTSSNGNEVNIQKESLKIELKNQYEKDLQEAKDMFSKGTINQSKFERRYKSIHDKYVQDTTNLNK